MESLWWDERRNNNNNNGKQSQTDSSTKNNKANKSQVQGKKMEEEQQQKAVEAQVEGMKISDKKAKKEKKKKEKGGGVDADGKPKLSRAEIKAQRLAARGAKQQQQQTQAGPDPLADRYGDLPMVQSTTLGKYTFTELADLESKADQGGEVKIRGRLHAVRGKGKSAFVVLRSGTQTVQVVFFVDKEEKVVSKGMVKFVTSISKESIIDIDGVAVKPNQPVDGCTLKQVEVQGTGVKIVSRAKPLPFEIADACRREDEEGPKVAQDTRLDNRYIELRTPANNAIFKIQSAVGQLFRENLLGKDFIEIHSPKLMAGSSEGGSSVFALKYMGRDACLAQSPQLCKQMAICADFDKVFEIGPVFRAENSNTHRHLCEFVGLDFEMTIKEHYFEILDVIDDLFVYMFDGLAKKKKELEAINAQYPFEPLEYLRPSLKLTFEEGVKMLHEAGFTDVDPLGDLSTETERALGKLVKEKYKTDFYILHRYPLNARPFYTMPAPDNPELTNSYDVFIRGEEIISGAQRIHDPEFLAERAVAKGMDVATIESYTDSFRYGAPPHGGCGVGLERVAMLYLGLNNIRKSSLFPRDPNRLTPP
jgi:aspartyl-tRNA synthetase